MFDNFVLQVSALSFNTLKMGGTITEDPLTRGFFFMGFKDASGSELPVRVKILPRSKLPAMIEMQMVQDQADV